MAIQADGQSVKSATVKCKAVLYASQISMTRPDPT